jgi:stress response protein YsnF
MAIDIDDPGRLKRAVVIGDDGRKLGTVAAVYYDNDTSQPQWVAVRTGLFGLDVSLVPLAAAQLRGDELHVPFDRERLASAPHHDPGLELSAQDEADLFRHYGVPHGAPDTAAGVDTGPGRAEPAVTRATAVGDAMTRSEEQLRVRTESEAVGRVRLRKRVVTEYEQVSVPVRREEIRLERDPVDGTDTGVGHPTDPRSRSAVDALGAAVPGTVGSDVEHEVVLHAERPVVRTETVPVERVRMAKQTLTEQERVSGEIRKEQIELDTDAGVDPGGHEPR